MLENTRASETSETSGHLRNLRNLKTSKTSGNLRKQALVILLPFTLRVKVLMGGLCKHANQYPAKLVRTWAALINKYERSPA